jgi:hypothetical protein
VNEFGRQDEILQLLFWMRGEKLGDEASPAQIRQFLQVPETEILETLRHLSDRGLLISLVGGDASLYRLTEAGIEEGKRRFTEEFAPYLGRESHIECEDPDCDCHSPEFSGVCTHLNQ